MEPDDLVKNHPDLTNTVKCTRLGVYYDGPCLGLASVKGEKGFYFLLADDEWGKDARGRLWAVYRLTPEQIKAMPPGWGHTAEPPVTQIVGWTTWVEGGMLGEEA